MGVVIGGAAGAWGDSSLSTRQLLDDGRCDYIIYEGLAEITMAILSRARAEDPDAGYARDLIETIAAHLTEFHKAGTKVVTNAGGVNPRAAAKVIRAAGASVGVVEGDDVSGMSVTPAGSISANVYLGARPIAAALDAGADVVITGRVVDSALILGPLLHEYGWGVGDFDLLSAGSLAGHLLECGPQSTGGLLTDWEDTGSWANPGFPIAEIEEDGSFVVTAPETSDAVVDVRTVSEQLLYEIGDPSAYLLPDVACDWRDVTIDVAGKNRVHVSGARGNPPPTTLKACAQVLDGWRVTSLLFVGGRDAVAKARRVAGDLVERGRRMLSDDFRQVHIEVLGSEDTYGPHGRAEDTREVVLKIALHHDARQALELFVREVPSIALAGPPGVSGGGMGLPRPSPLVRLECYPLKRNEVSAVVSVDGRSVEFDDVDPSICADPVPENPRTPWFEVPEGEEMPLVAIAHGRSGDKGPHVNVGVRARHPDYWPLILAQVTAERTAEWLAHLGATAVHRYELPGIQAVNLVLENGLGAGGTASLRFDPQGKAVAQQLLDMPVVVPREIRPR